LSPDLKIFDFLFNLDQLTVVGAHLSTCVSVDDVSSFGGFSQVNPVIVGFREGFQSPFLWHEELYQKLTTAYLLSGDWRGHLDLDALVVSTEDVST
jgi:hypothetical protein